MTNGLSTRRRGRAHPASAPSRLRVGVLLLLCSLPAAAQEVDLSIYSTAPGSGALVVDGMLETRVTLRLPFCPGGICPYSSVNPGFITPAQSRPAENLYALSPGTAVSFVAVAIDAAASVKIGSTVIDAAGESASLGVASGLHVHPEWQVQARQGEVGSYPVTFRLTSSSPAYADSAPYTLLLNNGAPGSPSPTVQPSATPTHSPSPPPPTPTDTALPVPSETATAAPPSETATPTPSLSPSPVAACAGDCNGDRAVTVSELITGVNIALGSAGIEMCSAFDRNGDATVEVAELIQAVNALLEGCHP